MLLATRVAPSLSLRTIAGRTIGTIVVLFMLMDAVMHVAIPAPVVEAFARIGYPIHLAPLLAFIVIISLALYVVPRTTMLGAILLTGYLGGAAATQLRAGSPPFEDVFPVIVGVLVWAAPYLLHARVRAAFSSRAGDR